MGATTDPQPLSGRRVFLVEDEYFIADDMRRAFAALGADIIGPVASRKDAFDLLASTNKVDLAVLDINLRGDFVFPIADELTRRGVPFVFATGYHAAEVPSRYSEVPRWEKPFDYDAFARQTAAFASLS